MMGAPALGPGHPRRNEMITKTLFSIAAALMTVSAFSGTLIILNSGPSPANAVQLA